MNKKIVGILVCTLLIAATVLPVAGTIEKSKIMRVNNGNNVIIQPPEEEWNKTYGGTQDDIGYQVQQTNDGGYIIAVDSSSFTIIKTNSTGDEEWSKNFIGFGGCRSVQQTSDDGYIICGSDWLIKTNSSGNMEWNKHYYNGYSGYFVQQTIDDGYVVTGQKSSNWGDAYLLKTDINGNEEWNRTFGKQNPDRGYCVRQTNDSGFIIAGYTESFGYTSTTKGNGWLIKTNDTGIELWNNSISGPHDSYYFSGTQLADEFFYIKQTDDEGFIIVGLEGKKHTEPHTMNLWAVKTNFYGNVIWNKFYGGDDEEMGFSVDQITEDGYIIVGYSESFSGSKDVYLLKINATGILEWSKLYGKSSKDDVGNSIEQTDDCGYIMAGFTNSYGAGNHDVWLIKLSSDNNPPNKPAKPSGPPSGKVGVPYTYSSSTNDPEGNQIWYNFSWGDGNFSEVGPYNSGQTGSASNTWNTQGTYEIKVKAKDVCGAESECSDPLEVTMPRNKVVNRPILNFLQFLQSHPKLFPLSQKLLQLKFGL